ncbi:cGMP-dependent protein kinase 2 [Larimichthys crocea]|uniref:cGMP-dependent protein kinase n=1 Tax=Larimichthys crocea TaxID=215358 RepID=A0A6G0IKA7_LARCR|nr:cGMP-dependent protein kinase 2 [Larimichthys crocea]
MGNGSMKSKRYKQTDGSAAASNSRAHKDNGGGFKNSSLESLRARVDELEREGKRRDEELCAKEQQIKSLQEQLAKQTRALAELSEELQNKCIQLNKLQDVMKNQSGASAALASRTPSIKTSGKNSPNLGVRIKETLNRRKGAKAGVSAEPTSRTYDSSSLPKFSFEKARVPKDASVKKLLTDALNKNQYLKRLELQQIKDMVECMYERTYQQGEYVIKQGEPGNHLFVLAAVNKVRTWALDREVFQNIMRRTAETRHEQYRNFLRSVSLLANLPEDKLSKIVDCLEVEYYDKGEYVIREGEEGSTFYIIAQGKVKVTQTTEAHKLPQIINTLQKGDYFGEKALISDDVRSANIIAEENGVECLVIDRETFDQTVGTFNELQKYLQGYVATLDRDDKKRHARKSVSRHQSQPLVAGRHPAEGNGVKVRGEDITFALKVIKKKHVVDNRQEEHIHSERKILAEARSPFVVKLYRTFKDNKYVYMLLEACLGGEIWSLLRDRGSFDEPTAKFCVGCVTEAFDYLHRKGVLYRDLKPENLMLDTEGYIKLVDFGFAKKIRCGQKTWTFCGTPEYVAPEIILNKGHNFSVDFWSLGILVFELLTGSPPFSGSDQMMTYTFILKGIEKMDFPKKITKRPEDLIRKLCRRNPSERLGNLKNGITDIKKHRWFNGFNWEGLKARNLPSPLKRELTGPTDHSYFDSYPPDEDSPPDELSGWDMDF